MYGMSLLTNMTLFPSEEVVSVKDDQLESLPFVASPWPTVALLSMYLWFVLRGGPRLMEKKPGYELRYVLMAYNLFLVVGSTWYCYKVYEQTSGQFFLGHCRPNAVRPENIKVINQLAWLYYFSKMFELLDTVFFVLRRKMKQVTFLHVYHHSNMAFMTWVFLKLVPGSQLMIIAFSNTFIHILMYSYYFLAAFGPTVQRYLWWKKYLTTMQIVQFFIIIGFLLSLLYEPGCQVPKEMISLAICNTASFLVLFLFFYTNTYSIKSKFQ